MKKWCALLLAAALLSTLCACRRNTAQTVEQTQGVTLNVVTSFGGEDGNRKSFEAAVSAYEASTGNRVNDGSDVSSEEWKARVLTDFETGSEPDVLFFFTNADAEPFIRAGKVVPLDEIRAEYSDFARNMDDAKLPTASDGNATPSRSWDTGKICSSTGRCWKNAAWPCRMRTIHGSSF